MEDTGAWAEKEDRRTWTRLAAIVSAKQVKNLLSREEKCQTPQDQLIKAHYSFERVLSKVAQHG